MAMGGVMSVDSEKVCIAEYEQREYDSISWANDDFSGKFMGCFAIDMAMSHGRNAFPPPC